jgi:hypothetical protein
VEPDWKGRRSADPGVCFASGSGSPGAGDQGLPQGCVSSRLHAENCEFQQSAGAATAGEEERHEDCVGHFFRQSGSAIYKKIVGMDDLVEEEATSADAQASKPAPDIFAAALKKAGVGAKEAIALGDTPYDAHAAGALGIRVIGVTCGGWKRSDLLEAGCAEVYQDPADLLLRFEESILGK